MDKKALDRALKELDEFLEQHPHLRGLQQDIDQMLEQCGPDPIVRLKFLFRVMGECLEKELLPNINRLNEILEDTKQKSDKKVS